MANRTLPEQLTSVRQFCQRVLSRKALATGIASTESFLLLKDVLWGVRFSMGSYHARWQVGQDEVFLFEEHRLIEKFEIEVGTVKKVA